MHYSYILALFAVISGVAAQTSTGTMELVTPILIMVRLSRGSRILGLVGSVISVLISIGCELYFLRN